VMSRSSLRLFQRPGGKAALPQRQTSGLLGHKCRIFLEFGRGLPLGHLCPTPGSVRGNEFVRRIQALGKERGVKVHWTTHRGEGTLPNFRESRKSSTCLESGWSGASRNRPEP
jgi:hypothetical protein